VSSGRFFAVSAVGFTVWLLFGVGVGFSIYWLQIGGTAMAGVAFLLVALVENQQRRSDQAVQRKLNAVTTALAELGETGTVSSPTVRELRAAVGLEKRESTAEVD
jgi:low affinity Fe/Cu permease